MLVENNRSGSALHSYVQVPGIRFLRFEGSTTSATDCGVLADLEDLAIDRKRRPLPTFSARA